MIAITGLPQTVGGSVYVANVNPDSIFANWGLRNYDIILDLNGEKFRDSQDFWAKLYNLEGQPVTLMVQSVETAGTQQGSSGETEAIQTLVTREVSFTPQFDSKQSALGSYAQINGIVPEAPADVAGIEPGDIAIAFNGAAINGVDDFRERTRENAGEEVEITLRRGEETFDVSLTPRLNPPEGQGAIGIVITPIFEETATGALYQEGLPQETLVSQPLDQAIQYGANRVISVITMTVSIPSQLVSGAITPDEARPVSVVGMSQIGAAVIRNSIEQGRLAPILDFIAVISVALGFFNLLPIPALDGGRIVFVLLEMVRGRPIAPEREGLVHLVGLALLLSLSVLIILNDVVNPITDMLR
jgi:regulator of sigma E protease